MQRCTSWTILINFVAKSIVLVSEVLKIRNHVTNIVKGSDIGIPNTYYGGGKLFQQVLPENRDLLLLAADLLLRKDFSKFYAKVATKLQGLQ